jgi:ribose transport system substrate-binding protein
MQRFNRVGVVLFLCVAFLGGCNKSESASKSGSASRGSEKPLKLAFVTNNASDFWTIARAGCDKAKSELPNVDVEFKIPNDGQAATQKRFVQDLIAAGVDGIAISPKDPANQTDILNEAAKASLLICHDSDAPQSNRACYVGTDNVAAGRQAGELIKKAIPNGGKIMVFVGSLDAQNAKDRFSGIKEVLNGSNVQIIDVRTDEADHGKAKTNVKETILNYPDIACLVGLWSYNGPAISNAVREANQQGKIKIVCFDEEDETLAGIKDGTIFATVVQQPYEFGHQAIVLMAKVLRGDKSAIPETKQIIIPTLAIQKDNVDEFQTKLNKLRGRA